MIRSFRHKGFERFFTRGSRRDIPAQYAAKLERHQTYSVTVSGNWRLSFRFEGADALDVNLEDYH